MANNDISPRLTTIASNIPVFAPVLIVFGTARPETITDAIVTAIEPQIYAAENFRSRRKPPNSEDAWAHTALGSVHFSTRRLDHSLAEFELALQLNPNFSLAQGTMPWRCLI